MSLTDELKALKIRYAGHVIHLDDREVEQIISIFRHNHWVDMAKQKAIPKVNERPL